MAEDTLMRVLAAEKITAFQPGHICAACAVGCFRHGVRPAGVWLVRQGPLRFALPITSAPSRVWPTIYRRRTDSRIRLDRQTVPIVARTVRWRVLAATDGANDIKPGTDGRSLEATWRRALVGGKTGALVEPGFAV